MNKKVKLYVVMLSSLYSAETWSDEVANRKNWNEIERRYLSGVTKTVLNEKVRRTNVAE